MGGASDVRIDHVRVKTDYDNLVHLEGVDDHTLCGLETCGDRQLEIDIASKTNRKIDCIACIQIIDHCKHVKEREIKRCIP